MKKLTIGATSFITGALLMTTLTAFADTAKQFVLTTLNFPVIINGTEFKSDDMPFMNYNGNTYVPLKRVGDMLDVPVNWNDKLKQVEIGEDGIDADDKNRTLKLIENYSNGFEAYQYGDIIYMQLRSGLDKYNLYLETSYDSLNEALLFTKINLSIPVSKSFYVGCDIFINKNNGTSYIKEDLLKSIAIQINES
ncbi:stalk domain-containing protein [Paenibacillus sp. HB172176]|uniref:stalk domain-containing protein n=1 Tax=Paenibacillus sp. HB172176 TaxID=2493690 RepID=UPI0014391D5D|nr:stalk domain-containing protein [Paenibacillus sp. HB172176]